MKKSAVYFLWVSIIFLGILVLLNLSDSKRFSRAEESLFKVIINGAESKLQPVESQSVQYVPLFFPLEDGNISYQINIECDNNKKIARIEKIKINKKLRGDHKCERCEGTGKCQACYPAGSGKNIQDNPCPVCDGTGKCTTCRGEGNY